MTQFFTCPHCHGNVPIKARACPHCGSDRETGWSEGAHYTALLPDKGEKAERKPGHQQRMAILAIFLALVLPLVWMPWSWQLVAVLLVIASFTYAAIVWGLATYTQSTPAQEIRLYEKLLMRAGGDRALVDRLIAYEQQQKPTANRLQLLQNALERWYRDRR